VGGEETLRLIILLDAVPGTRSQRLRQSQSCGPALLGGLEASEGREVLLAFTEMGIQELLVPNLSFGRLIDEELVTFVVPGIRVDHVSDRELAYAPGVPDLKPLRIWLAGDTAFLNRAYDDYPSFSLRGGLSARAP